MTRILGICYEREFRVQILWQKTSISSWQLGDVQRGDEAESAYLLLRTLWRRLCRLCRRRTQTHNATGCPPTPAAGEKEVTKSFYNEAVHGQNGSYVSWWRTKTSSRHITTDATYREGTQRLSPRTTNAVSPEKHRARTFHLCSSDCEKTTHTSGTSQDPRT